MRTDRSHLFEEGIGRGSGDSSPEPRLFCRRDDTFRVDKAVIHGRMLPDDEIARPAGVKDLRDKAFRGSARNVGISANTC